MRLSISHAAAPASSCTRLRSSNAAHKVHVGHKRDRLVIMRCMPAGDGGPLDLSGTEPRDAIIGDVDTEPRPGMSPPMNELPPVSSPHKPQPTRDASLVHALKAHIPKGPLAEDAAMCEPFPGAPPGGITDEDLASMRTGRPTSTPSRFAAAQASDASGGSSSENARSGSSVAEGIERGHGGSNAPSDSPEHIKQVVDEETLNKSQYNESRAKFNDL